MPLLPAFPPAGRKSIILFFDTRLRRDPLDIRFFEIARAHLLLTRFLSPVPTHQLNRSVLPVTAARCYCVVYFIARIRLAVIFGPGSPRPSPPPSLPPTISFNLTKTSSPPSRRRAAKGGARSPHCPVKIIQRTLSDNRGRVLFQIIMYEIIACEVYRERECVRVTTVSALNEVIRIML